MSEKTSRRRFLKHSASCALAAGLTAPLAQCAHMAGPGALSKSDAAASQGVRNILLILSDDHAAHAMGAYGNPIVRTPNLDKLAWEGILFERAYANAPVCTPSRQSLITGKYPHATGVSLLTTALGEDPQTVAEHLRAHGYATGAIGKMHFYSMLTGLTHGFDFFLNEMSFGEHLPQSAPRTPPDGVPIKGQWMPFSDPARLFWNADVLPVGLYEEDMRSTWYVRKAEEFLAHYRERPFFLVVSFNEPHAPFDFPIEYAGKYNPEDMPLPEISPEDRRWIPEVFRDLSRQDKKGIVASYYTSVEFMDSKVGELLDILARLGLQEDTLVLYMGDNGYMLGHHGRFEKHMMWEEAIRVPLLIRAPLRMGRGQRAAGLVEGVDLVPTMLEALGAPMMDGLHGQSLMPIVKGETSSGKEQVFAEYLDDNKAMIRTAKWKYIFTTGKQDLSSGYATGYGASGVDERLYDLEDDPHETRDLAGDPRCASALGDLRKRLLEVFLATHPRADALPTSLSEKDQLAWFCEPSAQELEDRKTFWQRLKDYQRQNSQTS